MKYVYNKHDFDLKHIIDYSSNFNQFEIVRYIINKEYKNHGGTVIYFK